MSDNYIGYDGGKADASGAMIFSIGSKYVYENSHRTLYKNGVPDAGGDWVHVSKAKNTSRRKASASSSSTA